ncbi:hypothetical protein [Undibacterium rugosum]|uniref:Type 1 fimbrial protein n=1 Tax=Undibacterium rugosum TaxID=2762291 RepID=A0A923KWM3_9BURK|nr:hypothetical protein [Undibacterium rugosum]MBC3936727.1 hypothetical protein [Undibacterium rugosum]MBR7779695.1 hypothetical protein [Undibacterium rugosum]
MKIQTLAITVATALIALAAAGRASANDGRISFSGAVTTATCHVQAANNSQAVSYNQCHSSITQVKTTAEVLPFEGQTVQVGGMSKISDQATPPMLRTQVSLQGGQAQWPRVAEMLDKYPGSKANILVTTEYQ